MICQRTRTKEHCYGTGLRNDMSRLASVGRHGQGRRSQWRSNAGGVCQVPLYIKLSDEIGKWGGDITKAKLPDQFMVDYVRVYDLVDDK